MASFELVNSFAQAPVMLAGFVAERPCHIVSFPQITNEQCRLLVDAVEKCLLHLP
jgi:hypothetical protein